MAVLVAAITCLPAGRALAGPVPGWGEYYPAQSCETTSWRCPEIVDSEGIYGKYVGHDEPSVLFYSDQPGSATRQQYRMKLPVDPVAMPDGQNGVTWNFQSRVAFWFGLDLCDPWSFPNTQSTCTPDSDANIDDNSDPTAPDYIANQPGGAYMELQFYPPGWVADPYGLSCSARQWCGALTVTGLSEDQFQRTLNSTCSAMTGVEYQSFAFLTKDGHSQAPADPMSLSQDPKLTGFTPDLNKDLLMNPGDDITVTIADSPDGLVTTVDDLTLGTSGSMTASAANGYGSPEFQPDPSTACIIHHYNYRPMYSTSSYHGHLHWTAHTYNVAYADEIGHFDYCDSITSPDPKSGAGACSGNEGTGSDKEPSEMFIASEEGVTLMPDADETYCVGASHSTLVQVTGCLDSNLGFDGYSYKPVWPDGDTVHHPTSIHFTSPLTGANFDQQFKDVALESDLPALESAQTPENCETHTGLLCTPVPMTDDNAPADFYPFFSVAQKATQGCYWLEGNDVPGETTNDFGKNNQYGTSPASDYHLYRGVAVARYYTYRNDLGSMPCPATAGGGRVFAARSGGGGYPPVTSQPSPAPQPAGAVKGSATLPNTSATATVAVPAGLLVPVLLPLLSVLVRRRRRGLR
jgi:hypothetical protein